MSKGSPTGVQRGRDLASGVARSSRKPSVDYGELTRSQLESDELRLKLDCAAPGIFGDR